MRKEMGKTSAFRILRFAALFLSLLSVGKQPVVAQVFMDADGKSDAYARIVEKGYGEEAPDCLHNEKHIKEEWDATLKKYVFAFILHKEIDGDRCNRADRQRNEIKTFGPSPENMKAGHGETHYYRWKFKLDKNFQPSPNFCHIHQLKAGDGPDSGSPLITITPRYGTPDKLQLIYTPSSGVSGGGTLKQVDLAPFKGEWIEAIEKVVYNDPGEYSLVLKRVSDDAVLFEYESNSLDLWREGSTFNRPKYGIYRSINSLSYLRDETVLFADISLTEGTSYKKPEAPATVSISVNEHGEDVVDWKDNSDNEDQFRIDVSADHGKTWGYFSCSLAGTERITIDKASSNPKNIYRVRAENTLGNSGFAVSGLPTGLNSFQRVNQSGLKSFPNPFQEMTRISYTVPVKSKVKLAIYNQKGSELKVLVNSVRNAGNYSVNWIPEKSSATPVGCYFARLITDNSEESIQLVKTE